MALRVAIYFYPTYGHVFPAIGLAIRLHMLGHAVRLVGPVDFADSAGCNNVAFSPIFEARFPRNSLSWAWKLRDIVKTYSMALVEEADRPSVLRGWQPNVVLADYLLPIVAMYAYQSGIPAGVYSTSVPLMRTPHLSPASCSMPRHADSTRSTLLTWMQWKRIRLSRLLDEMRHPLSTDYSPFRMSARFARVIGFPKALISFDSELVPFLRVPTAIICPKAFSGLHAQHSLCTYVAPYLSYRQQWHGNTPTTMHDAKPVILCSLGSNPHLFSSYRYSRNMLVEAARVMQDYCFLIIDNDRRTASTALELPNVMCVSWVSQQELMQRSQVVILHGGLGGIMEAITYGIPMIIMPLAVDQLGNASRIEASGLGLRVLPSKSDVNALVEAIRFVDSNRAAISDRMRPLQEELRADEDSNASLERFLGNVLASADTDRACEPLPHTWRRSISDS